MLERADSGVGGRAELAGFVGRRVEAERGESPLKVSDRLARLTPLERRHGHDPRARGGDGGSADRRRKAGARDGDNPSRHEMNSARSWRS